ncbi:energy-coupling factor transporter transmembrane component T family protein [Methanosarcina horonobensis]|uniref:energy-coupling factor transporter transmembrane component T family protein n=1 Tax=Methanosarcina horonobensis TaxID=418008 RepID=UPI000B23CFAF|nr:energy-coupling factor transporter transmembrane protein EcfT [Methanosarcina horonobensis]
MKWLFRYEQKNSLFHRLDPRVKLLWLFGISVLSVVLGTPYLLVALFASTLPFWLILKPSKKQDKSNDPRFRKYRAGLYPFTGPFLLLGKRPAVNSHPSFLSPAGSLTGGVYFYADGAVYGLYQSFRFMTSLSAAMLVLATTHPSRLISGLVSFFEIKIRGKKLQDRPPL